MKNVKILLYGLLHALGVLAYIFAVAWLMINSETIFGRLPNSVFGPTLFLTLFVISAAITGSLVALRPAIWYLAGQKIEALKLLFYTIGWLALGLIILFICLTFGF